MFIFNRKQTKKIPNAYGNENSTGHLNMIYTRLLSGQIKQSKTINLLFPTTSFIVFSPGPIFLDNILYFIYSVTHLKHI